jgi:hypothetical protein
MGNKNFDTISNKTKNSISSKQVNHIGISSGLQSPVKNEYINYRKNEKIVNGYNGISATTSSFGQKYNSILNKPPHSSNNLNNFDNFQQFTNNTNNLKYSSPQHYNVLRSGAVSESTKQKAENKNDDGIQYY